MSASDLSIQEQVEYVDEELAPSETSCCSSSRSTKKNRDVEFHLRKTTPFKTDSNNRAGDMNQVECLISALRETLLTHRWYKANDVLMCLARHSIWTTRDYTWKCGAEVVYQHAASNKEIKELFFRKVETSNFYNCKEKHMERVFNLLRENQFEEAYKVIQDKVGKAGQKTKWQEMTEKEWKKLIVAYTGLIEFALWTQREQTEDHDENEEESKQSDKHGELAINNIMSILDTPGIWDVFILCYIELMKPFDDNKKLKSVLMKYNEDNPGNPNSYVYLYQYLQSTDGPLKEQISILEKLVAKVPSSEFVLELYERLHILERRKKSRKITSEVKRKSIVMLFDMLDYACWQDTVQPWKLLCDEITRVRKRHDDSGLDVILNCWKLRISWWPSYHFRKDQAVVIADTNPELAPIKATIAGLLLGEDHEYVKIVCGHLPEVKTSIASIIASSCIKYTNSVQDHR
ncbi:TATA box-binding protein-associated factor RNA polymerase I subunit A-like isoform X2 [Antedon mediterranea]|uniref:TATA box-binding protein-associated factor RNA polymerase I subunit A-like isoform X2 n=1 Tax=Antedon mediterranea TaxID=105859 RepID=UPI003AF7AC49